MCYLEIDVTPVEFLAVDLIPAAKLFPERVEISRGVIQLARRLHRADNMLTARRKEGRADSD